LWKKLHKRDGLKYLEMVCRQGFVVVQDIINSIHNSISKINDNNAVYNIASGKTTTIKELVEFDGCSI